MSRRKPSWGESLGGTVSTQNTQHVSQVGGAGCMHLLAHQGNVSGAPKEGDALPAAVPRKRVVWASHRTYVRCTFFFFSENGKNVTNKMVRCRPV